MEGNQASKSEILGFLGRFGDGPFIRRFNRKASSRLSYLGRALPLGDHNVVHKAYGQHMADLTSVHETPSHLLESIRMFGIRAG